MNPKHAPGEPVNLIYLDGFDEVFLHGHVEPELAAKLAADFVRESRAEDDEDVGDAPRYGNAHYTYARWGFGDGEFDRHFYTHAAIGRGSFPVTVVHDLDERDRRAAVRDRWMEAMSTLVASVRAAWPTAELTQQPFVGLDKASVTCMLPGLKWKVQADSESWPEVMVCQGDLEAFRATYADARVPRG